MKRRKMNLAFVAQVTGMTQFSVAQFIQHEVYPFNEIGSAILKEGSSKYTYVISVERLREHFPFTDEELQDFYENKRAAS